MNLPAYIGDQRNWSERTFGYGRRTIGLCEHIRKELAEIEQSPLDLEEWIDVIILAIDGAWRAGYEPEEIVAMLEKKQDKNLARKWPEPGPEHLPTEHVR